MIGQVFGRLTVKRFYCFRTLCNGKKEKMYECECSCQEGRTHITTAKHLRVSQGGCKSCGCLRKEMALEKLKRWNDKRKAVASE
jgi:hypothetical protein